MAGEGKGGADWQDDELDVIVADYFVMLKAELAGKDYVKAHHNKRLIAELQRSHRSIEFKHGNVSAVLERMGLPWIRGYRPRENFQKAIFPAIDRYLARHPEVLEPAVAPVSEKVPNDPVFVEPPPVVELAQKVNKDLQRLVRKYDPATRDQRNRSLGKAGEEFVVGVERHRLETAKRADLARKVRWVADEEGDGAGYDVHSFEPSGEERLLEVKTTNGSARTPFFLSRNECSLAEERPKEFRIYRVHLFATERQIFTIAPPLRDSLELQTEVWRAGFVHRVGTADPAY